MRILACLKVWNEENKEKCDSGKVVEVERGQTMKIFGGHVHKLGLHLKSNEKTLKGF